MNKALISSSFTLVFTVSLIAALGLSTGACRKATAPATKTTAFDEPAYKREIEKWQSDRIATLTKPDSWLSLVGLFWLNEGENRFGSAAANPIRLPANRSPLVAGTLWLENGRVRMAAHPAVEITAGGIPVKSLALKDDTEAGGPTVFKFGTILMNIIKRGDRVGVRVKDMDSRTRREFKGLEYYPVNPKWRIEARFEPYQPSKIIPITNVLSIPMTRLHLARWFSTLPALPTASIRFLKKARPICS